MSLQSLPYSHLYLQFKYMTFIYSQSFIHHFTGLFGTNIVTSSQLACQLSQQSTAPVSYRSGGHISYSHEFFQAIFSLLLKQYSLKNSTFQRVKPRADQLCFLQRRKAQLQLVTQENNVLRVRLYLLIAYQMREVRTRLRRVLFPSA